MRTLYFCAVVSFYLFSSPNLSGRRLYVCHTFICMRLARNTGCKNNAKMRHLRTISQLCRAMSSQLRHVSTIGEKVVMQQYLLHMSLQYGELQPTNGWNLLASLGHPNKFQRVSRFGFVTACLSLTRGQPNFARCLAISWVATLYIHFRGLLPPPWRNFAWCKIHFSPSLEFSYIGSVTARHSSSRRQLYSAGRPSRWALAHILVIYVLFSSVNK